MTGNKVSIRPVIKNINHIEQKTEEEKFQNVTLRPIIKLQHDLLVAFFQNYMKKKKVDFAELSAPKKNAFISNVFKNDIQFKTELRGLIIGHFTLEEYTIYQDIRAGVNKRIMSIIKERLLSLT